MFPQVSPHANVHSISFACPPSHQPCLIAAAGIHEVEWLVSRSRQSTENTSWTLKHQHITLEAAACSFSMTVRTWTERSPPIKGGLEGEPLHCIDRWKERVRRMKHLKIKAVILFYFHSSALFFAIPVATYYTSITWLLIAAPLPVTVSEVVITMILHIVFLCNLSSRNNLFHYTTESRK